MGWTLRQTAQNYDGINVWDSLAQSAASYTGATHGLTLSNLDLLAQIAAFKTTGGFSYVQGNVVASGLIGGAGVASATLAFLAGNSAGNCIVVDIGWSNSGSSTHPTVTDSAGNTYALVCYQIKGGSGEVQAMFAAPNIVSAGSNTITVTWGGPGGGLGATDYTIAVNEYSGIISVSPVDATVNGIGSGLPPTISLSLTTTQVGDVLHFSLFTHTYLALSAPTGGGFTPVAPTAWLVVGEVSGSPATLGIVDRSSYLFLEGGQHSWQNQIRQRGKASYTLRVFAGDTYAPTKFQPVYLSDQRNDGTWFLVFAGILQDYKERWINGTAGDHFVDCDAVSFESLYDTRYVEQPQQYVNQTCGFIVTDLLSKYGSPLVIPGTIQAGATIPLFNANKGDSLASLFSQLATTSLFTWWVNPAQQSFTFALPSAIPAPFTITNQTALWGTVNRMNDGADYRNRQAVKLSFDAFGHSMEFFVGANQQSFTLLRPVEQVVNAYVTLSTCNTATLNFSGQPTAGDTFTIGPAAGAWQSAHVYSLGGIIVFNGYVQKVTTAGTSGGSQPAFSIVTGQTTTDNSVIWTCQGPAGLATGTDTYTAVAAASLDNTVFGEFVIGGTLAQTVQNAADAINANAAATARGVTFSLPTWENSQCNAITIGGTSFIAQQKAAGTGWVSAVSATGSAMSWSSPNTAGGTSPQGSVGPNQPATITIQVYAQGTSTAAPGLSYTKGSAVVNLATPLNSGTNLNVEYTRSDGNVIEVESTALVTALASVTGGTGKFQRITDQSSTGLISTSSAAGLQLAQEALAAFDVVPSEVEIVILEPGLMAGQAVTLAFGGALGAAINGTYYTETLAGELIPMDGVEQLYLSDPGIGLAGHYKYSLKLINIAQIGSDLDFWQGIGGGGTGGSGSGGALVATSGGSQSTNPGQAGLPSPLTTKGDLWGFDTTNDRIPVGSNTQVLTADSTQALGLKWAAASPLATKGDVYTYGTANARLPVGTAGQVLTVNAAATDGIDWETPTTYAPLNQSIKVNGVEFSDDYFVTTNQPTPVTVNGSAANPPLMMLGAPGICAGILSDGNKVKTYNTVATAGVGLPPILAATDLTGQTTAQTVATFTPGANGTFRLGGYVRITAIVTDVLQLQIGWTDETSTAQTLSLVPAGFGSANLSATGTYQFSPVDVRAKSGVAVTVKVIFTTGIGSVTYDAGGSIMQLT